ncbi:amino acid adenylation domain-containing protein [Paenibacillus sp. MER TA 81-3]|uniref:non-ribosomal peptide synthetase n=1 Tax=Paenibacillus sp. MER TA 81-3 TaxID=2939573 RepID=UPI00203A8B18|nr:non-ribosomal peptide synthetase [Paenibacillus sp. MER TA 81-3]MCM3338073.1 amino acid adenylation domain-containing protein [Paenibacillus sp. MER TA 81-3]
MGVLIEDIYKLSPMQQGMFFHSLYDEGSQAYITQVRFCLHGELNTPALAEAWQQVLGRHPVLRTSLVWEDVEEPYQVVQSNVEVPIIEHDWSQASLEEQEERFASLLTEDREATFDLKVAPLMRVTLVRLQNDAHRVLWTFHHLLLDGWSIPVVIQDLFSFYNAIDQGTYSQLPEVRPYGDYSEWLEAQDMGKAEQFWRNNLQGFAAPTTLPADIERGMEAGYAQVSLRLSRDTTDTLNRFARKCRVTPNTLFQSAWALFLSSCSGEEDVLYGTTVSGRPANLPGVETMVGLFINTLPVRMNVSSDAVLGPWLRQAQARQAELRLYEYSPLLQVQGWSDVPRGTPLFDSLFVFENIQMDSKTWDVNDKLSVSDQDAAEQPDLPLTVIVLPGKEAMLRMLYDVSRFSEKQVYWMLNRLQVVLEAMSAAGEGIMLKDLPLITAEEERMIVQHWNDTSVAYPSEYTIHRLFEKQVAKRLDHPALRSEGLTWSYAELNRCANTVARKLVELGIRHEQLVPMITHRSPHMVIGMLAILKAGGAYVPIDPAYPSERIEVIVEDCESHLLLAANKESLPAFTFHGEVVFMDELLGGTDKGENLEVAAAPSDLAYVMYTSGSTGRPKGVMVEHRNVIRLVKHSNYVQFDEQTRMLQTGAVVFDAATLEVWGALLNGGQLVVLENDTILDGGRMKQAIEQYDVNTMFITAPLLHQLSQQNSCIFNRLHTLMTGGDVLSVPHMNRLLQSNPGLTIVNAYGPTENTTISTTYCFTGEQPGAIPIGRPIANSTAYVVDRHMRLLPAGMKGELIVGGDGVARGYRNRPDLTEEKFMDSPFRHGERCYRTGDLVRYRGDGIIEFIGRIDSQVKIRGFRIEPGEIEHVLVSHPQVRDALVIAAEAANDDKRLVAYTVVEQADAVVTADMLRNYLKADLPEHMIPAVFVLLASFPLMINGKVDRRALPAPDWSYSDRRDYAPPRNDTEKMLCDIWQRVLGIEQVGIYDNFFELGGDSILSIQVVTQSGQAGLRLTPKQIFEHRSIAELAEHVGTKPEVDAEQGEVTGVVPLIPIQRWFFEQQFAAAHHWNQALLLTVKRPLEVTVLEQAFAYLLAHHDALRMRFGSGERPSEAAIAESGEIVVTLIDLSSLDTGEQDLVIEQKSSELQASLNLKDGPLIRVAYFERGSNASPLLLIIIHHLAVDGVSWRILLEDLETLCNQLSDNLPVKLPAKTTSFKRWGEVLHHYARSEDAREETASWVENSGRQTSRLPLDVTTDAELAAVNTVANSTVHTALLSESDTLALLNEVPGASQANVPELLFAAIVLAMGHWTGKRTLLAHMEGHGREEIVEDVDLSRTIGWFTTMYPVNVTVDGASSPEAVVKAVKEQLRSIPNKGIGYGVLRYLSDDETAVQVQQLAPAEISFNYLGRFYQAVSDSTLFDLASSSAGSVLCRNGHRPHLLDINVMVVEDRFHLYITYCHKLHKETTIAAFAQWIERELQTLIQSALHAPTKWFAPSDFPLAVLSQHQLDRLVEPEGLLSRRTLIDIYPLSSLQAGMLYESLLEEKAHAYCQQSVFTLRGHIQPHLFEHAWQHAVDKHDIFRTVFVWEGVAEPHQAVVSQVSLPTKWEDWRDLPSIKQAAKLDALLQADREHQYDLLAAPLMRIAMIRTSEDRYKMVWSFHHLLLDGWSLQLVWGEVLETYEAAVQGQRIASHKPKPYKEFIQWTRQQNKREAEAFWRNHLQGVPPTRLTMEQANEAGAGGTGEYTIKLTADATNKLQQLSRSRQLTMGTLIQGAWAFLLSRYSGNEQVMFGVTVAGRPTDIQGADSMVGLFINTLPMKATITPEERLVDWLERLQQDLSDMRQYEHSSLIEIQGWSDVPRGTPLIESLVVFENYPTDTAAQHGVASLQIEKIRAYENPDLPLTIAAVLQNELSLHALYDQNRFSADSVERLFVHFTNVLNSMAANPEQRIGSLHWLSESEQSLLISSWNDTTTDYPRDKTIHQLFEDQATRRPTSAAVISNGCTWSYRELNEHADKLAHVLQERGIGRNKLVPILAERSVQMVVGMLAILKAGGAYVPIDPNYPSERIAMMLEDTTADLLLVADSEQCRNLPFTGELLVIDEQTAYPDKQSVVDECERTSTDTATVKDLAYVMYTSGSTGRPKGVMVEHCNVVRLVANTNYVQLNEQTRILQTGAVVFDASTFEVWGALLNGGQLYITEKEVILDGSRLKQELERHRINTLWLTAPLFHQFVQQDSRIFSGVQTLIAGGDVLSVPHVNRVLQDNPELTLVNGYGPTENTTFSLTYAVQAEEKKTIPIGRPIANSTAYVVDKHMNLLPVGAAGELLVGGDGVARGYWNRPDLTAEKFIASPFRKGERCYRTGDLVSYRSDGVVEFLGRMDEQVKIRGYRIEPGEIERVLASHSHVGEVYVRVMGEAAGEKRLIAYVVPEQTVEQLSTEHLRQYAKEQLPEYMIPTAFVQLNAMPLTVNGKVDRNALPAPDFTQESGEAANLTQLQQLVASLWSDVLNVSPVRIDDHFFDLGGHSLLATQLISRVREVFQIDLSLRTLFEAPTLNEFAGRIEAIRKLGTVPAVPISAVSRSEKLPLSFAQQRLWFLDQLGMENQHNNIYAALRLQGNLNVAALEQALNEIVRRHESLRTTFVTNNDGQPEQVIVQELTLTVSIVDLSLVESAEQETVVQRLAKEEASRTFRLSHDPLIHVSLVVLHPEEHVMLLTMHHIISDGWSIGVLVKEWGALYEALCCGKTAELSALPLQYADYAVWQRDWLSGEHREVQLDYWMKQVSGLPSVLELPLDKPRPAVQTFYGAQVYRVLPTDVLHKLEKLSIEEGATLFMTLLTGFHILLHRYTEQDSFCVGTPVANRSKPEIEGLIGFFVNMLPIRADFNEHLTVRDLLRQSRETALDAYDHQDLPFEQLVDMVQPVRSLSHTPIFQVVFDLLSKQMGTIELPGLKTAPVPIAWEQSKFDLGLTMIETTDGMLASFTYNTDLFEAARVERMLDHLFVLFDQMASHPEQCVGSLQMLTSDEQQQLLEDWNDTVHEYAAGPCVHEWVERRAAKTPDAIAVVCSEQCLTYRELNRRANQLAHHLAKHGIGAEMPVGICMERSVELIIAVLGVLKSGGAYVPLDPHYPKERLRFIMDDTQVPVLLTVAGLLEQLPEHSAAALCLDSDWPRIAEESGEKLAVDVNTANLAYVIYTSGSTGQPKGVQVQHDSLLNLIQWHHGAYQVTEADRATLIAGTAFDASVWEIWPYLTAGAALYIADDEIRLSPEQLRDWLIESGITLAFLPTPLAERVISVDWPEETPLRALLTGGDKLHHHPEVQLPFALVNHYGPTENTVVATCGTVASGVQTEEAPTIGRPIANTRCYILDASGQPVPIGVPGELYIAGSSLARGYLNRPELTAERFVQDPFRADPQARMYRTGDLCRYRADGEIEYVGRMDDQVKIRGFRIELGEVETVISHHPDVEEASVITRQDVSGQIRLVAYVVPAQGQRDTADAALTDILRQHVSDWLPDYMIPSAFVMMERLPLTPNGKIDRRALPEPEWTHNEQAYEAGRNSIEEMLCTIWAQVIGRESVGIHDNFFELGGDSIMSIQVVARAGQVGLKLTAKQMFQHQTIAELAATVEKASPIQAEQGIVTGSVPFTPIQRWFFDKRMQARHHWNQAILLTVKQPVHLTALEAAVERLFTHHDALRMRYIQTESGWNQVCTEPEEKLPFTSYDLSGLAETEQKQAMEAHIEQLHASLDLHNGPLLRAALFNCGAEQPARLLLTVHHLVVDGVSWRIVLEDLQYVYKQIVQGKSVHLPPKTTSFKTWAERLQQYAQSDALEAEQQYWAEIEAEQEPCLPIDQQLTPGQIRAMNTNHAVRTVRILLDREQTKKLLRQVPAVTGAHMNDILLTPLLLAIEEWSGQQSVSLHLESHGREELFEDVNLSRTVGWFTSMYPIKLTLADSRHPLTVLGQVKEQLRQVPSGGIGYGLLRYLQSSSSEQKQRLQPQIIFNYLGQLQADSDTTGYFGAAPESIGTLSGQDNEREALIEVNGVVTDSQLTMDWRYCADIHDEATIQRLADSYATVLSSIISDCQDTGVHSQVAVSAAEFGWNETELENIFEALGEMDEDL